MKVDLNLNSGSLPLVQLKYRLNTFCSQPKTSHVLNIKCRGNHAFFKVTDLFENGARYISSCHLRSK